jgi:dipeptidyl aminopeptidase/acylaminoacyl peptidase
MTMRGLMLWIAGVMLLAISVPMLAAQDGTVCAGAPASRLVIGSQGRATPGSPTNIRSTPSTRGTFVGQLLEGQIFDVLDGPICADGYAWWEIDLEGMAGWAAEGQPREYWMEPYPPLESTVTAQPSAIPTFYAPPSPAPIAALDPREEVIVYADVMPGQNTTSLFVMNPDGSNPRQIMNRYANQPVWSPDGRWLIFSGAGLTLWNTHAGNWGRVMTGEVYFSNFEWSPDSRKIAVTTQTSDDLEIQILDVESMSYTNLTAHPGNDYDPSWSPDGSNLVFVSDRDGSPEVYRIDADGKNAVRLSSLTFASHPMYSPDGTQIAWASNAGITLMDADGGNVRPLIAGEYPTWSPDGERLTYEFYEPDKQKYFLEMIDTDGENRIRIVPEPISSPKVSWSGDRAYFIFEVGELIYRANADGSNAIPIGRGKESPAPSWRHVGG